MTEDRQPHAMRRPLAACSKIRFAFRAGRRHGDHAHRVQLPDANNLPQAESRSSPRPVTRLTMKARLLFPSHRRPSTTVLNWRDAVDVQLTLATTTTSGAVSIAEILDVRRKRCPLTAQSWARHRARAPCSSPTGIVDSPILRERLHRTTSRAVAPSVVAAKLDTSAPPSVVRRSDGNVRR